MHRAHGAHLTFGPGSDILVSGRMETPRRGGAGCSQATQLGEGADALKRLVVLVLECLILFNPTEQLFGGGAY